MTKALDVHGLRVSYGAVVAIDDLAMSVDQGEILAVLGPNGAGKTSLVEAISGRVPSSGQLLGPNGVDLQVLSPSARARTGIGFVPQGRELFHELTVHENLLIGGARVKKTTAAEEIERLYQQFPLLAPIRTRLAGFLSGGEKQTLAVARALVPGPKVLILDEPSFGLSPAGRVQLLQTVASLRTERDLAVVLTEQFAELALSYADKALVMAHGAVAWNGSAGSLDREVLNEAYFGGV